MSDTPAIVVEYKPLPEIEALIKDLYAIKSHADGTALGRTSVNVAATITKVIDILSTGEPFHPEPHPKSGQGGWRETARMMADGNNFYRGIVDKVGKAIGEEAYVCDDGSVSQSVLALKLVELVEKLKANQVK